MALRPDVAVISEAAKPKLLVARAPELADAFLVWVGKYPNQGLLLAGFGTTVLDLADTSMTIACTGQLRFPSVGCPVWTSLSTFSASAPRTPVGAIDERTIRDRFGRRFGETTGS